MNETLTPTTWPSTTWPSTSRAGTSGPGTSRAGTSRAVGAARTPSMHRRRPVRLLAAVVLAVIVLTMVVGRSGAQAELADPVAGHVVVAPGETLWDVAVATAPEGVDARRQLAALREINGLDGGHLDAWSVVLVPAR